MIGSSRRGEPLKGVRVLDLGIITAGASTSAILADLGAEVIKIESPRYIDPFRMWKGRDEGEDWWNRSRFFHFTNRNKKGISLDLKAAEGRSLFLDLVAKSDIVVENFRRGVLERLSLTYRVLADRNPRIILVSVTSQGETGPEREVASFGSTLEAVAGLASMTGYPEDGPLISGLGLNYPDQVVSLFAAGAAVAALRSRQASGRGAHLDISQRELTTFLVGEAIVAAEPVRRTGNAAPEYVLQDCFRAADGRWVAVSMAEGQSVPGSAPPAEGSAELRDRLARWIAGRVAEDAVSALQHGGIAASPVLDGADVLDWVERNGGAALARGPDGNPVKGLPFAFRGAPPTIHCPAPRLGEHTAAVLRDVLALDEAEIERLLAGPVTGSEPASARPRGGRDRPTEDQER